jgi:hypothetical protein
MRPLSAGLEKWLIGVLRNNVLGYTVKHRVYDSEIDLMIDGNTTSECQEFASASDAESVQPISHAEFATGMKNATIGCLLGEPYGLRRGVRKTAFYVFTLLYMAAPAVLIPLWAYHMGDWWLLIGIGVSYMATFSAGQYSRAAFYFSCYCIGFWIHKGFNFYGYTTFYFFCALWGYLLWHLADTLRMGCARRSLIESAELYNAAVADNRIRIVRLDPSHNLMLTSEDMANPALLPLEPNVTLLVMSNIVVEAFTCIFGLFTGSMGAAAAYARGINDLAPDDADSIMRRLTRGTVGFLAAVLGYFVAYGV